MSDKCDKCGVKWDWSCKYEPFTNRCECPVCERMTYLDKDAEIERLARENEGLRKDAERYRWIRTAGAWESEIGMDILSEDPIKFDRAVDDYLDDALAKQGVKDE